jgi:putative peptidoglycan lipid II flippase
MRLAVLLGSLASGNILLGFIYQWYTVTTVGPGAETDALYAGMVVPQLVLAIIAGSLTNVLVPLLSTQRGEGFYKNAWSFFLSIGSLFSAITGILFVTSYFWVPWTVPGFDANTKSLTLSLVRIQLVGIVLAALTAVLWSVNYARQRFIWVELSSIISNMIGFGLLIWGLSRFGIVAAAWAMILKTFLQTLFLLRGLGPYSKPDWRSESLKEAWRRLKPLLLGTTYYKTDQLVDRFLASMVPAGGLTLLYMAQQLYGSGSAILNKSIVTPMVPTLSNKAHTGDWQNFRHIYLKRLFAMVVATGLGFLIILIFGQSLLTLLFGHKRFDTQNVATLWWLLIALGGLWVGGGMGTITSSTYYAKGDTRTPTRLGIWTYTIYLPLKVASFILFKLTGLAISTSLFYMVNFILQLYFLRNLSHEES